MSGAHLRSLARQLWQRAETLHAVTYFAPETKDAGAALGLDGFWLGYFGMRAAPLGPVGPGVVDAAFHNFAPTFVRRWVPRVWDIAEPGALLAARSDAAAAALDRLAPDLRTVAEGATSLLATATERAAAGGRALFAANRDLPVPDDPVAALWHQATLVREHRGDGHVAALTAAGLGGIEVHVLLAAERGLDPALLQRPRGWDGQQWDAAATALSARGLVDREPTLRLTTAGRALRADIERTTDALAAAPWASAEDLERAIAVLDEPARAVARSGLIPYPNPIGLPAPS